MCEGVVTKIGSPTNCMWTGLRSLRAMWHKMIQFWEIMPHRMLCNENLDKPISMMTLQKSIMGTVHKCTRQLYKLFFSSPDLKDLVFLLQYSLSRLPRQLNDPRWPKPCLGNKDTVRPEVEENIVNQRSCSEWVLKCKILNRGYFLLA